MYVESTALSASVITLHFYIDAQHYTFLFTTLLRPLSLMFHERLLLHPATEKCCGAVDKRLDFWLQRLACVCSVLKDNMLLCAHMRPAADKKTTKMRRATERFTKP